MTDSFPCELSGRFSGLQPTWAFPGPERRLSELEHWWQLLSVPLASPKKPGRRCNELGAWRFLRACCVLGSQKDREPKRRHETQSRQPARELPTPQSPPTLPGTVPAQEDRCLSFHLGARETYLLRLCLESVISLANCIL